MPRDSIDALVADRLNPDESGRYLDLCVDLMRCTDEMCGPREEHLLEAGGRWDRVRKAYVGPAQRSRRLLLQDAQLPAARWFRDWLSARRAGRHVLGPNGKPSFTLALVGGRRGGKSDLAPKLPITYLLTFPRSIAWLVVPKFPDMPELETALDGLLPRAWYTALGDPWYEWTFANGSRLEIRSSYDPDDLKRGRCDVAVIHEAQKHDERAYAMLRPAIADKGGLVILAANPPNTAKGEWVADLVERSRAGKSDETLFNIDPKLNPHVDHAALDGLRDILDERTYAIEIRGDFLARKDVVIHAFSPTFNVRPEGVGENGEHLEDVTEAFTARMLGSGFVNVHGMDFQGRPYMAAVTLRLYRDPDDPLEPLVWARHDFEVEQASEDDLVNALEGAGYTGADAVIPDASGAYQDAARTKGHGSWDTLRARGWRKLFYPVANSRKNPEPKTERLAILNGLCRSASGKRRFFVAPTCAYLIRALRLWEMRSGIPHWRSDYAHIIDALTYPLYRLFPRRAPAAAGLAVAIKRPERGGWETIR